MRCTQKKTTRKYENVSQKQLCSSFWERRVCFSTSVFFLNKNIFTSSHCHVVRIKMAVAFQECNRRSFAYHSFFINICYADADSMWCKITNVVTNCFFHLYSFCLMITVRILGHTHARIHHFQIMTRRDK